MSQKTHDVVSLRPDKALGESSPNDELSEVSEEDCYVPVTSSDFTEKAKGINRNLQNTRRHKSDVVKTILSNQTPSMPTDLGNRLGNLQISLSLVTVINHIADNQFRQARKQAQKALSLAHTLNDKLSIARCRYWMGRIEFEKQNMEAAHDHFLAAHPCLMDDVNPEGETLLFYLNASNIGTSEESRKSKISQHNRTLVDIDPGEGPVRRPIPSRKRKREAQPCKVVLRPASGKSTGVREKHLSKAGTLNEWIIREMPDLPLRLKNNPGTSTIDQRSANYNGLYGDYGLYEQPKEPADEIKSQNPRPLEGMGWLQAANSRPRMEQLGEFTFRCYPVGLAPRTRPTNLFSKLPDEVLLSAKEWDYLKNVMANCAITMAYLAKERQLRLSNKE